ncbi:MAG: Maf family nucleotide pyrophosphatase [Polynucleobacter sp.]|nr:Maf family nucleotide pyrophosphatase [Polynucleobacter sp.]
MSNSPSPALILASSSAYRRELLSRLGLPFECIAPNVDESPLAKESVADLALRLAKVKANAIAQQHPHSWVIGSDQAADLQGEPIGKPGHFDAALAQLQRMRGQVVHFHTALCLMRGDHSNAVLVATEVRFRNLPDEVLINYLRTEEPYDCAGSAKSEGMGIVLLDYIRSDDPTALIGLPLIALTTLLRDAGFAIPPNPTALVA